MHPGRPLTAACLLLAGLSAAGGCGKRMWVTRYPAFYSPQLRAVGVAAFRNRTDRRDAGVAFAEALRDALVENGSYEVTGPESLARLLKLRPGDVADLALDGLLARLRKVGGVQAIVRGNVKAFAAASHSYVWTDYGYGYGHGRGLYYRRYGPDLYYVTRLYTQNQAFVAVSAELVRVADGKVLARTPSEVGAKIYSDGDPPRLNPYECLARAAGKAAADVVGQFAPVEVEVELDPKEALRTARGRSEGRWEPAEEFSTKDEAVHVAIALPAVCDRNRFRLEVRRQKKGPPLAVEEFVWSAETPERAFTFDPAALVQKAGKGEFEIVFRSGEKAVFSRKIRIR